MSRSTKSSDAVWEALTEDTGVGVCVVTTTGGVEFANTAFLQAITGRGEPVENLSSLMSEGAFDERMRLVRAVEPGESSLLLRETWRGVQYGTRMRLLSGNNGSRRVLMVMRSIAASEAPAGGRSVRARHGDEGPLTPLSPRERTVLSLVGSGMSTAQMAEHLGRSPKTIENQRHSIARKLGVRNRVEMARVAIQTGLATLTPRRDRRARR